MSTKFTTDPHDRNCLSFWYPQIRHAVPTPETFYVTVSDGWRLANLLDGGECWYFDSLCEILWDAAKKVGLPCFLRTGQGSGKHDWKNCCYLTDAELIPQHVMALVEWSHMVDMMGLPHGTWVIREMLDVSPVFRCTAFGGMPVVREWRYFVADGELLYGIPYWPEEALEQGRPDKNSWRDDLPFLHSPFEGGEELARKVAEVIPGRWSVDVLETANSDLYVTDMAIAEQSWGWKEEPYQ